MEDVTLPHAKEHLEELMERAARGEDVRISDPKVGTMRLVPSEPAADRPQGVIFGQWSHLPEVPLDRLLAPLTDEELEWLSGERSAGD